MRILDRRRHQLFGLAAGIAEHDALVARAFVLVAGGVDALRDIGRLLVDQAFDLGMLPVEAFLLVADQLDALTRRLDELVLGDAGGTAHLARKHDAVGGGERLAGDARRRIRTQEDIDHRIGNLIAYLVRMSFRYGLAGTKKIALGHVYLLASRVMPNPACARSHRIHPRTTNRRVSAIL